MTDPRSASGLLMSAVACFIWPSLLFAGEETVTLEGVVVSYDGIGEHHAQAIGRTVATARTVAIEKFGFDMPPTITVRVTVAPQQPVRLFNDGQDRFSLSVHSEQDLRRPGASGIFHIYGLCHEVGHLAMYRPIQDRRWMTTAAAEGWAHYLGSRLVDEVYAQEGESLWPDSYDYRVDGMQRLEKQLASGESDAPVQGARLWKELVDIVGDKSVAPVFATWGKVAYEPADPGSDLARALEVAAANPRVPNWWDRAGGRLVVRRPKSMFTALTTASSDLAGEEQQLAHDDGKAAGKRSTAGGGHAVRFEVASDAWYLKSVRIHGGRYGHPQPPKEDFHVWLCDNEFNQIAEFKFPYAKFKRGPPRWVSLDVKPTQVPREFIVCVGFNPTATKGVYVSFDGETSDSSLSGLPGREPAPFEEGDWLIRVTVAKQSTTRKWTDASGKFSVEAELVEVTEGEARLRRDDGKIVAVAVARLSEADQQFIGLLSDSSDSDDSATASAPQLSGNPQELKHDDGDAAGKKSFPRGHAVAFDTSGETRYLTGIRIHGSRYGLPRAPNEDFHVSLCDAEFKLIADFEFPYAKFARGAPKWVQLKVKPTKIPSNFVLCVNFNPTRTKGVYVSHDADGEALVGLPGKRAGTFSGGDWLIRATVDALR